MADANQPHSEAPVRPGDNPNKLNAKRRGTRPKTKNSPSGTNNQMRLNWIDPLPVVDTITPIGIEPNVDAIPAGEIDLDFFLPETISQPFADTVHSVADRLTLDDDQKEEITSHILALGYFKAARQLYSTMLDHEKTACQPLKSVYYDETPIPVHMAGALGIIGHIETKVGQVMIRDAPVLFRRWIVAGLQKVDHFEDLASAENLVWSDSASLECVQRKARETINQLVERTYEVHIGANVATVSMPQLTDQDLDVYFGWIHNGVPEADRLRSCVSALQVTRAQWRTGENIPHDSDRDDICQAVGVVYAEDLCPEYVLRELFEDFCATHTTKVRAKLASLLIVGPPPAGSQGYGAQIVSAKGNQARWNMPLSDADVHLGYMFSPNQSFTLNPRLVGYSTRKRDAAAD